MIKRNIFVMGDLVVDHTIFAKSAEALHQPIEHESVYEVLRRQNMAGGAANTARLLSMLNAGKTFLCGVVGHSIWGNFRSILEASQLFDGARSNIDFRGISDETNAQMNTISRVIRVDSDPPDYANQRQHDFRFDEYLGINITRGQTASLFDHLVSAHRLHKLEAIILNDLDMGCITKDLANKIARFAEENKIRLFIDPKRDKSKYDHIEALVVAPNLLEWCYLTGQDHTKMAKEWRLNLSNEQWLREMAQLSLQQLPNFRIHLIKCDVDGAVLIVPSQEHKNCHDIYHIPPYGSKPSDRPHQLGPGDVMLASLALKMAGGDDALNSFKYANGVVGCYLRMPWHQMPSHDDVAETIGKSKVPKSNTVCSSAILYLPKPPSIRLSEHRVPMINQIVSSDPAYRRALERFIGDVLQLDSHPTTRVKSIMLGAPSGSGKSTILEQVKKDAPQHQTKIIDYSDELDRLKRASNLNAFLANLVKSELAESDQWLMIIVDEALKGSWKGYLQSHGVLLLEAAGQNRTRFCFVDTGFDLQGKSNSLGSEFTSRCKHYQLPGISDRPKDIAPIIAANVKKMSDQHGYSKVAIEAMFLARAIEAILATGNMRQFVETALPEAFEDAHKNSIAQDTITLRSANLRLPDQLQSHISATEALKSLNYDIFD